MKFENFFFFEKIPGISRKIDPPKIHTKNSGLNSWYCDINYCFFLNFLCFFKFFDFGYNVEQNTGTLLGLGVLN